MTNQPPTHTKQDGESLIAVGAFIIFIAIPVLIGTFWADRTSALVVNLLSGLVLLVIGVAMTIGGWRFLRSASS